MNKHEMEVDNELFEILYELEGIELVENINATNNMVDISVSGTKTFLLETGILSHNSAANSVSKILGRDGNGFFAMFGVPLNAYDSNIATIIKSKKMIELKNILGLEFGTTTQNKINFKEIIITTDYDLPGHFITGQLIGLLFKFGKNLFDDGRVKRFVTPLLVATDSKENIVAWFYSFDDYKNFEAKHKTKKYHYDYKKGMGSWDPEELEVVIKKDGLEKMLETFVLDEKAAETIENWLGNNSQARKDYLENCEFDIMSI